MTAPETAVRRLSMVVMLSGLAFVAVYYLLSAFEIGKIGAPSDIGGGLILLAGYVITSLGVILIGRDLIRRRSKIT